MGNFSSASETPPDKANESQQISMEVPDGGLVAWTTVAGAWLVLFSTFGYLYSFGVYQDFYTRIYLNDRSPSSIAWIGSFQLMMPFALGVVSGKLLDDGYFHVVEILGSALFTFSLFMLSLAKPHQYYQIFLSQGLGMGIGLGLTFVPTLGITMHHFKRHRALASGIALSGGSTGAIIFPIMLNHLIPSLGFAKGVRATAYVVLGCLTFGNALMRTRLPPRSKRPQTAKPDVKSFFTDTPYMLAAVGCLISTFGLYFPLIYLQLFAVVHNIDNKMAFYSLAIINGTGGVGRIFGNYLGDLYGCFNVTIPCTFVTGALIWAVLGVKSVSSLVAVSVFYGIFSGAFLSLSFAALSTLARGPEEVGTRVGLALALSSFGSLGSAPVQGALLTSSFLWMRPIAFSATLVIFSAFLLFLTRAYVAKRLMSQWV